MYQSGLSIPEISEKTGTPKSTIRFKLIRKSPYKPWNSKSKKKASAAQIKRWDRTGRKGVSLKPNGYLEFTHGPQKGRSVHRVIIEKYLGRKLDYFETIHHCDGNRSNNKIGNLELMSRAEHARIHRAADIFQRKRNSKGQFIKGVAQC
jgi:hypothetical protein